jgi:hypothetical protein
MMLGDRVAIRASGTCSAVRLRTPLLVLDTFSGECSVLVSGLFPRVLTSASSKWLSSSIFPSQVAMFYDITLRQPPAPSFIPQSSSFSSMPTRGNVALRSAAATMDPVLHWDRKFMEVHHQDGVHGGKTDGECSV